MEIGKYITYPTAGDRGSKAHLAVTESFRSLDTHTHDGVNSEKLSPLTLEKVNNIIAKTDFVLIGDEYKATHNLPSGYSTETATIKFTMASGSELGVQIFPTVKRVTSTQIEISVNTNAYDVRVVVS